MPDTITHININSHSSSIEIGTPGKLGAIKAYVNPLDMEEAKRIIDNLKELRKYAQLEVTE